MATILCIEDERSLRDDIVEELSDAGYKVLQAENGQQGLETILAEKPDLVLCDLSMPVMGGREMLSELRNKHPEFDSMPFMFLSALMERKVLLEGLRLGADDYLMKPVDYDVLLLKVQTALKRVQRLKQAAQYRYDSSERLVEEDVAWK
ncbi:MAG: response regulator [Pseudomonadota bacterium]|nr:response regulator [Pseudomonadota bacterium]